MTFALKLVRATNGRSASRWLLASLSVHALVLVVMMFFVHTQPGGPGKFGLEQGGDFSVTWIPGPGGGGQGVVDTVVPGDEFGESFEAIDTDPSPTTNSSLLAIVETDPQKVFSDEFVNPPEANIDPATEIAEENDVNKQKKTAAADRPTIRSEESMSDDQISSASHSTNGPELSEKQPRKKGNGQTGSRKAADTGSGRSPGGGGNQIHFFGIFSPGKRVVYVIDASESMRKHKAMEIAREELTQSLRGLDPASSFQIIFFDLKTHSMPQPDHRKKLLKATDINLRQAELFLKGIQPDAGTDRFLALTEALSFETDIIYLLTDADEPVISAKQLWEIQRGNKRKAIINVVEFGIGADLTRDSFLKQLARQNYGKHHYRDLTEAE